MATVEMTRPWKVIQELEADNSRLKKEAIIRRESDADNIRFFNGVGSALDGFRTFGVQKVPVAKADGKGTPLINIMRLSPALCTSKNLCAIIILLS